MNKCNRCNVTEEGGGGRGGRGYEMNKHLSGLLVYRLIVFFAEKFSSNCHACPQSFTFRLNIGFVLESLLRKQYRPTY